MENSLCSIAQKCFYINTYTDLTDQVYGFFFAWRNLLFSDEVITEAFIYLLETQILVL